MRDRLESKEKSSYILKNESYGSNWQLHKGSGQFYLEVQGIQGGLPGGSDTGIDFLLILFINVYFQLCWVFTAAQAFL